MLGWVGMGSGGDPKLGKCSEQKQSEKRSTTEGRQGPPVHVKGRMIEQSGLERPYACVCVEFEFNFISYEEQLKLFDVIKAVF